MWNGEGMGSVQRKMDVIIFDPVGWGKSSLGHVATTIDGLTYSFTPDGMFVEEADAYMSRNVFRNAVGFNVKLTNGQIDGVEQYLRSFNRPYSVLSMNCASPVQFAPANAGVKLGWSITPDDLERKLFNSSLY